MRTNGDDFCRQRDRAWTEAFDILVDGCEIPPSFELFQHGLEQTREKAAQPVTVQAYARYVVESYHRVPFPEKW